MTLCSEIVRRAMVEFKSLASTENAQAAEALDGMAYLNSFINGLLGNGIGHDLTDLIFEESDEVDANSRVLIAATASMAVTLPETPKNGDRVQIIDLSGNFATYPVTLARNGRRLESAAANLTLNTNSLDRTWIYRADIASWERVSPLELTDDLPFPDDEAFVYELAFRFCSPFGEALTPQALSARDTSLKRLLARYFSIGSLSFEPGLYSGYLAGIQVPNA